MPWIAIDKEHGLVYEGWYRYGAAVLPTPVTVPAAISSPCIASAAFFASYAGQSGPEKALDS